MRTVASHLRSLLLVAALLAATTVLSAANGIRVFANGKPVASDVPPLLENDAVYLPLRATAEALGAKLEWQAETKTAVLCTESMCFPIRTTDPESGAKVVKGRVFLALRKAADALGAKVTWDASARRVDIVPK